MLDSALRVVLGTMTFAGQTSQRDAATMLRTFLGAGHVEIDTARMYMSGETESCIGAIFEEDPALLRLEERRVGQPARPHPPPPLVRVLLQQDEARPRAPARGRGAGGGIVRAPPGGAGRGGAPPGPPPPGGGPPAVENEK